MVLRHTVRVSRFVSLTGVGLALTLGLSGCNHTAATQPGPSFQIADAELNVLADDAYAAIAPAAGESENENTVPLIEAINGLAPQGKSFVFDRDVNINMPVPAPQASLSREEQLARILAAGNLTVRDAKVVLYIENAAPASVSQPVSEPEVPAPDKVAPELVPPAKEEAAATLGLAPATMMNAPVVAPGEVVTPVVSPKPAEAPVPDVPTPPVENAPVTAVPAPAAEEEVVLAQTSPADKVASPAPAATASQPLAEDGLSQQAYKPVVAPVAEAPAPVPLVALPPETKPVEAKAVEVPTATVPAPAVVVDAPPPPAQVVQPVVAAPAAAPVAEPAPVPPVVETARFQPKNPTEVAAATANEVSQMESTTGIASDTTPAAPQATASQWEAQRGQTLRTVLENWCSKADVQLVWSTDFDYPLAASISLNDSFENAVRTVLSGFAAVSPQPVGRLHRQGNNGQRVLIIETRGNLYQEQ